MKKVTVLFFAFLLWSTGAQAALVTFDLLASTVELNDIFTVDITGEDFPTIHVGGSEGTQGGGVNLFYDSSIVSLLSVSIDTDVWSYAAGTSTGTIDNGLGEVSDILVTDFPGVDTGSFVVATLEFQAVGSGTTALTLTESTINPWGAAGSLVNPSFVNGSIIVQAVPVPSAVWLFGSGLLGLVGMARRKKAT
jgi:hypothetical protein